MFRGCNSIPPRGVHYYNAPLAGRGNVHIVKPGPGSADDFEAGSGVDEFGAHLSGTADGQPVNFLDGLLKLFRTETWAKVYLDVGVLV